MSRSRASNKRRVLAAALLVATALASACGADEDIVRVGAKSFKEQAILAQILVRLLHDAELSVDPVVNCKDTYGCHRALTRRKIDLMVEYTGTALVYHGVPHPRHADDAHALARSLDGARGLRWFDRLGFDNSYLLVVPTHRAAALKLRTIADLAQQRRGVRFTCPRSYIRRPRDGLGSLILRHGIRPRADPLLIDDPLERLHALLEGRADVAVVYATDGALRGLGVTALVDSLGFFPPYEAAVVARKAALSRHPGLAPALEKLTGQLSTITVRRLNYQAQIEGQPATAVARRYLRRRRLVSGDEPLGRRLPDLRMALSLSDRLDPHLSRAMRAVRKVFADRPVRLERTSDPILAVARGRARLALLGAEHFFRRRRKGRLPQRERRVEAVAVVATRLLHLVRRVPHGEKPLSGRIGIPPLASSGGQVASLLLELSHHRHALTADVAQLLSKVSDGHLDGALFLAAPADAAVARSFAAHDNLVLHPLPRLPVSEQLPFLRLGRIPANTYPRQRKPIETRGSQVVIAGPSHHARSGMIGGPAALPHRSDPLSAAEVAALAAATEAGSTPDTVLPAPEVTAPQREETAHQVADTLINIAVLAFIGWVVLLTVRRRLPLAANNVGAAQPDDVIRGAEADDTPAAESEAAETDDALPDAETENAPPDVETEDAETEDAPAAESEAAETDDALPDAETENAPPEAATEEAPSGAEAEDAPDEHTRRGGAKD